MVEYGIIIKFRGEVTKIIPEDIIFIEQNLRKVLFHLPSEVCSTYGKIGSYETQLPQEFFKCNKSYIINLSKVVRMREQTIFFCDGNDLRLGRQSFCGAKKAFLNFLLQAEES